MRSIDDEAIADAMKNSGFQRSLRASLRRPALQASRFQPKAFAPLNARWQSTNAKEGKISAVIGAIVDSTSFSLSRSSSKPP